MTRRSPMTAKTEMPRYFPQCRYRPASVDLGLDEIQHPLLGAREFCHRLSKWIVSLEHLVNPQPGALWHPV